MRLSVCQVVLKSGNLLHKRGLDDSQFHTTVKLFSSPYSGRKTLRVFRARDGVMIANYRVPSDLSSLESTTDGYSVVLGKYRISKNINFQKDLEM